MSIIYRYISRQLLANTLVVSGILVLILVGGRLLRYLEHAAEGRILGEVILTIMAYRLPEFLEMILPLGMFIGILLTFGRLYMSNEMSVLSAAGISQNQLVKLLMLPTLGMAAFVAVLSLVVGPIGLKKSGEIMFEQRNNSEFETLSPGRFHVMKGEQRVTYTERLSTDRKQMEKLFIAEINENQLITLVAKSGIRKLDEVSGLQYLELNNGYRYESTPGMAEARVIQYELYRLRLDEQDISPQMTEVKATPTIDLMQKKDAISRAELQWRISLPILVPVVVLLAIPLSRVSPRQGRFVKIFPAILLYLIYLSLLVSGKSRIEKGELDATFGLWSIHLLFLFIALLLHTYPSIIWKWRMSRV